MYKLRRLISIVMCISMLLSCLRVQATQDDDVLVQAESAWEEDGCYYEKFILPATVDLITRSDGSNANKPQYDTSAMTYTIGRGRVYYVQFDLADMISKLETDSALNVYDAQIKLTRHKSSGNTTELRYISDDSWAEDLEHVTWNSMEELLTGGQFGTDYIDVISTVDLQDNEVFSASAISVVNRKCIQNNETKFSFSLTGSVTSGNKSGEEQGIDVYASTCSTEEYRPYMEIILTNKAQEEIDYYQNLQRVCNVTEQIAMQYEGIGLDSDVVLPSQFFGVDLEYKSSDETALYIDKNDDSRIGKVNRQAVDGKDVTVELTVTGSYGEEVTSASVDKVITLEVLKMNEFFYPKEIVGIQRGVSKTLTGTEVEVGKGRSIIAKYDISNMPSDVFGAYIHMSNVSKTTAYKDISIDSKVFILPSDFDISSATHDTIFSDDDFSGFNIEGAKFINETVTIPKMGNSGLLDLTYIINEAKEQGENEIIIGFAGDWNQTGTAMLATNSYLDANKKTFLFYDLEGELYQCKWDATEIIHEERDNFYMDALYDEEGIALRDAIIDKHINAINAAVSIEEVVIEKEECLAELKDIITLGQKEPEEFYSMNIGEKSAVLGATDVAVPVYLDEVYSDIYGIREIKFNVYFDAVALEYAGFTAGTVAETAGAEIVEVSETRTDEDGNQYIAFTITLPNSITKDSEPGILMNLHFKSTELTESGEYGIGVSAELSERYNLIIQAFDGTYGCAMPVPNGAIYFEEQPSQIRSLVAAGDINSIVLSWTIASEISTEGYRIYRKKASDENYTLCKEIENRNTLSYTDKDVEAGTEYQYYIVGKTSLGNEGKRSDVVSAISREDDEAPVVTKLIPANNSFLTGISSIKVTAEDNIEVKKIELYVEGSSGWELLCTENGTSLTYQFNSEKYADAEIRMKAVAYDANGNHSDGTPIYTYNIDNQGPGAITDLSYESNYGTIVTLYWKQNAADKDLSYYQIEQLDETTNEFEKVMTSTALGVNIKNLTPGTEYTYRVVPYDVHGNRGEESEAITVTTAKDSIVPVVTSISPKQGYYNSNISMKFVVEDDYSVKYIKIQTSDNNEDWTTYKELSYSDISSKRSISQNVSLSDFNEGELYIRAIAEDEFGNISDSSKEAPYVQFIVDKTAPQAPDNVQIEEKDGYLNITWDQGAENDLNKYQVFRATQSDGDYQRIATNLTTLNYIDRNIQYGTTYYYKVAVNDKAGNLSEYSAVVSGKGAEDSIAPEVKSISPASSGVLGGTNKRVRTFVVDNQNLQSVELQYKIKGSDEEYQRIAIANNISNYYKTLDGIIDFENLEHDQQILVRTVATDIAGNETISPFFNEYTIDKEAPIVSDILYQDMNGSILISWKGGLEADLSGYIIWRVKNGSRQLVGQKSAMDSEEYTILDSNVQNKTTYTYVIEAVDKCGNTNSISGDSITVDYNTPPQAALSCNTEMELNTEYLFDASESSDDEKIVSYIIDFGDGYSSNQRQSVHKYTEEGKYTVSLTVKDQLGLESTITKQVTVKDSSLLGKVLIKVVDQDGAKLIGVPVYFKLGETDQSILYTNNLGQVEITASLGTYVIGCLAQDYLPAKKSVNVTKEENNEVAFTLVKQPIVTGTFEIHQLTPEEIKAAGIDISRPENHYVTKVNVNLQYGTYEVDTSINCNASKEITYGDRIITDSTVGGNRIIYPVVISTGTRNSSGGDSGSDSSMDSNMDYDEPIVVLLDVPVAVSTLSEFFDVKLHIMNNASEEFALTDNVIHFNVPEGLSLVKGDETVNVSSIPGNTVKTIQWYLKGEQPGDYYLDADFAGVLSEFNKTITAKFVSEEPIQVLGHQGLKLRVEVPDALLDGKLYYATSLINTRDTVVYKPSINTIDQLINSINIDENDNWSSNQISDNVCAYPDELSGGALIRNLYVREDSISYKDSIWELKNYFADYDDQYGLEVEIIVKNIEDIVGYTDEYELSSKIEQYNDIQINGKGYGYARFLLKDENGNTIKNTEVSYSIKEHPEYGKHALETSRYGVVEIKTPLLTETENLTVVFTDVNESFQPIERTITATVNPFEMQEKFVGELGAKGSFSLSTPSIGARIGRYEMDTGGLSLETGGKTTSRAEITYSKKKEQNDLNIKQTFNWSNYVEICAKLGGTIKDTTTDETIVGLEILSGSGKGTSQTTGTIGLEIPNFDVNNEEQKYQAAMFWLNASPYVVPGNAFFKLIAELTTNDDINYSAQGSALTLDGGTKVLAGKSGKVSASLYSGKKSRTFKYKSESSKSTEERTNTSSVISEDNMSLFTFGYNKTLEENEKIGFSSKFSSLADIYAKKFLNSDVSISTTKNAKGELKKVSVEGAEKSNSDSLLWFMWQNAEYGKVDYYDENAISIQEENSAISGLASGEKQFFSVEQLNNLVRNMNNSQTEGKYSHIKTYEQGTSFDFSFGAKAGVVGTDIGLETAGKEEYSYVDEQSVLVDRKVLKQSESVADDMVQSNRVEMKTLLKTITSGSLVTSRLNEIVNQCTIAAMVKLAEVGDAILTLNAESQKGTVSITGIKKELLQGTMSMKLLTLDSSTDEVEEAIVSTAMGSPYIITVLDENGEEVEDISSYGMTLQLKYDTDMLEQNNITSSNISKIQIYRWDDEKQVYILVGGEVNLESKCVTADISLPGQYILACDGEAPVITDIEASDKSTNPIIRAKISDLSGIQDFSFKLDGVEKVSASNLYDYYNTTDGIFVYKVENNLIGGEHEVSFYATDTSGNKMEQPLTYAFEVNDNAPVIGKIVTPTSIVNGQGFEWTAEIEDDDIFYVAGHLVLTNMDDEENDVSIEMEENDGVWTGFYSTQMQCKNIELVITAYDETGNLVSSTAKTILIDGVTNDEFDFSLLGASIRLSNGTPGIRFGTQVNKNAVYRSHYTELNKKYIYSEDNNLQFGTIMIPETLIPEDSSLIEMFEEGDSKILDVPMTKVYSQNADSLTYVAVLVDIPETKSAFTSRITACSYVKVKQEDGTWKYQYADNTKTLSYYEVAKLARTTTYSDENIPNPTKEQKEIMEKLDEIIGMCE